MNVRLLIHLEPVAPQKSTWWVESPDVPGFTGAADSLQEARVVCERAVREILEERGVTDDITFSYEFPVSNGSAGEAVSSRYTGEGTDEDPRSSASLDVRVA
jgi:predicted RNase H-like HicB family nuclease